MRDDDGPAFDTRTEEDLERERLERRRQRELEEADMAAERELTAHGRIGAMFKVQAATRPVIKKQKRKRLQEITRTSEDGFLVVEKVWVDCSDEEQAPSPASLPKKTAKKSKLISSESSKPRKKVRKEEKKGKQSSMMSFFSHAKKQ